MTAIKLNNVRSQTIRAIANYYKNLRRGPQTNSKWRSSDWDLITNEGRFLRLINSVGRFSTKGKDGLAVGVSIGGALETHAYYAKAEALCYLDLNSAITHAVVPAMGILLMESESREIYCKRLLSTEGNPLGKKRFSSGVYSAPPSNAEILNENVESCYAIIDLFLKNREKAPAKRALYAYFKEFAEICSPSYSSHLLRDWDDFIFNRTDEGHRFWLATENGWKYLKERWEGGFVYAVNIDLSEPSTDKLSEFFKSLKIPMSIMYSSNAFDPTWICLSADRDKEAYPASLQSALKNMLSIPRQNDAVWVSSFLVGSPIKGAVLPLNDVDHLLNNVRGNDWAHLLLLYLAGIGSHIFSKEFKASSYMAHINVDENPLEKLSLRLRHDTRYRTAFDLYRLFPVNRHNPELDYLFYKLDDPKLAQLRSFVFSRIREFQQGLIRSCS